MVIRDYFDQNPHPTFQNRAGKLVINLSIRENACEANICFFATLYIFYISFVFVTCKAFSFESLFVSKKTFRNQVRTFVYSVGKFSTDSAEQSKPHASCALRLSGLKIFPFSDEKFFACLLSILVDVGGVRCNLTWALPLSNGNNGSPKNRRLQDKIQIL